MDAMGHDHDIKGVAVPIATTIGVWMSGLVLVYRFSGSGRYGER